MQRPGRRCNAGGVDINGGLKVQGSLVLVPDNQPANPQTGSIYIDNETAKMYYYDGTGYQVLLSRDEDSSFVELQTTGSLNPQVGSLALTGSVSANSLIGSGNRLTDINAANITTGVISNNLLAGQGIFTIVAGNGLSGGGASALGGATQLNTIFGSSANTSVQGNTIITCSAGTGNLSGGGNTIALGAGGTCGSITITDSPTFNGTLTVSGNSNLAALNVSGSFTNAGSTLLTADTSYGNYPAGGAIGAANTTVDARTSFAISQTSAGQTLSLPNPTDTTAGRLVFVINTGSANFTMHGVSLNPNTSQSYIYNGSSWISANIDAGGLGSEADTLATVTARGATTATSSTFSGGLNATGAGTSLAVTNNATIGGTLNGATISGGTLSGGSLSGGTISGGTLTGTAVNGVNTADILLSTGSYADPLWLTSLAKSKVGLGNVENTALSTWAGSTNLTTLGTIGSGVWNGTALTDTYVNDTLTIGATGSVDWAALNNYPAACAAGQAITALGDSVTCNSFAASSGSGNYIQNTTALQSSANTYIESAAVGSVTAKYRVLAGQTADIIQIRNTADNTTLYAVAPSGNVTGGTYNSATISGGTLMW